MLILLLHMFWQDITSCAYQISVQKNIFLQNLTWNP